MEASFHERFASLFEEHFQRVRRYLVRLSGEPELASDLAQDAFVRLYRRGSSPEMPEAWLITVATNLLRNARTTRARRMRLLEAADERDLRPQGAPDDDPRAVAREEENRQRVREALDRMPEREIRMLLLRAEGYRYRDIAAAVGVNEASVGTLLARAKRSFRMLYEEKAHAPR